MDGSLHAIACASVEVCTHGIALVTSIYNPDELDPLDVSFNPLLLLLFLLFLVNAGIASTEISAGTTIENFYNEIGNVGSTGSSGACSMVVVVANTIEISYAECTVVVCSEETTGETKCARTILRSSINYCLWAMTMSV
ncbi:hypothetical protein Scep_004891 [Stephania cephalantha]|uniref:Uncharacterized protein n=1 Tax=Stephania cephalantha TaxID=152367 RepID=A0AAP0PVU5_9MAGN